MRWKCKTFITNPIYIYKRENRVLSVPASQ